MKKLLKIKTPNKKFVFKNREIRTPVTIEATADEFKYLLIAIKAAGVTDFTIDKLNKKNDIVKGSIEGLIEIEEEKEVVIEEIDLESQSILQKLGCEEMESE